MRLDKGDVTIAWDEDKDAEMTEHIQALMDKGVIFCCIEATQPGKDPQVGRGPANRLDQRYLGSPTRRSRS
jgi:hypothetical protein